ncbi:hypothetical protein E3N88_44581 [Mikania micrantha]|uniref:Uncharacterized protein n=1 Tax=Mikania micrantha TaxID=192012 RepID=A0A5N6LBK2_9ASTR|nr:hypothetical protein E3N88_44581 [Mikania micrantha]
MIREGRVDQIELSAGGEERKCNSEVASGEERNGGFRSHSLRGNRSLRGSVFAGREDLCLPNGDELPVMLFRCTYQMIKMARNQRERTINLELKLWLYDAHRSRSRTVMKLPVMLFGAYVGRWPVAVRGSNEMKTRDTVLVSNRCLRGALDGGGEEVGGGDGFERNQGRWAVGVNEGLKKLR